MAPQELLHHCSARADFHRLAARLSRERLACAWPYTASRARTEVGPDGSLTLLAATPATIACLAALLPELHATTVVLSGARAACVPQCPPARAFRCRVIILAREDF